MEFCLHHLLKNAASKTPDRSALRFNGANQTYSEFAQAAAKVAHCLAAHGVRRGDPVALYMHRGFRSMAGIFGILEAGGGYVPLDSFAPTAPLAAIVRDCDVRCIITDDAHLPRLREIVAGYENLDLVIGCPDGNSFPCPTLSWDEIDRQPASFLDVGAMEEDLSVIYYTSGSTGTPKGVAHNHRSMLSNVQWARSRFGFVPEDRFSAVTSHHFDLSWLELFASIGAAGTLVLMPESTVKFGSDLASLASRERLTVWCSVPSVLIQLVQHGDLGNRDLASLRWVLFAGERMPTKHLQHLMSLVTAPKYCNMYGTTETHIAAYYPVPPLPPGYDEPLPIGRPCEHVNLMVVDGHGQALGTGQTGELVIRGPNMMDGYWRQPERTAKVVALLQIAPKLQGLCYRTGDLAHWDEAGNIHIVGRADRRVKVRGYLVDLDEIEKAMLSHPAVREAAIYVDTADTDTGSLTAAVVFKPEVTADPGAIRAHIAAQVPAYATPQQIHVLPDLPRTGSGKISRKDLSKAIAAAAPAQAAGPETIAGFIVRELLNGNQGRSLAADTELLESGMIDSTGVMRLVAFLDEQYGVRVEDSEIIEPNFRDLASIQRLVDSIRAQQAPSAANA
jgi:amino acid adenylation domain-containing protein